MQEKMPNFHEVPNHTFQDKNVYQQIMRETHGKYFFCDNTLDETIPPFNSVLNNVLKTEHVRNDRGDEIIVSNIDFRGSSYLKTTIKTMKQGNLGEPTIVVIPGYGNIPLSMTVPYLTGLKELKNCGIIGVEVFHDLSPVDRVKVGSRLQNLQIAFASAIKATQLAIQTVHKSDSKVLVLGASFGAKAINAYLNLSEEFNLDLADRFIAIEGGRFTTTFSGPHYINQMINPGIVSHEGFSNGIIFPYQSDQLSAKVGNKVITFVNPTDDIALAQESCWNGAEEIYLIPGSHFTGAAKSLLKTRKIIVREINRSKIV